jgi:hypothetical protein
MVWLCESRDSRLVPEVRNINMVGRVGPNPRDWHAVPDQAGYPRSFIAAGDLIVLRYCHPYRWSPLMTIEFWSKQRYRRRAGEVASPAPRSWRQNTSLGTPVNTGNSKRDRKS